MLVMAKDAVTLQAFLTLLNCLAVKIGLVFNNRKCVSLHYSCKPPAGCRRNVFNFDGGEIPYIQDGTPAVFLGKPIGAFLPKDLVTIANLKQRAIRIMSSKLAPCQRLDCLKTFFILHCYF